MNTTEYFYLATRTPRSRVAILNSKPGVQINFQISSEYFGDDDDFPFIVAPGLSARRHYICYWWLYSSNVLRWLLQCTTLWCLLWLTSPIVNVRVWIDPFSQCIPPFPLWSLGFLIAWLYSSPECLLFSSVCLSSHRTFHSSADNVSPFLSRRRIHTLMSRWCRSGVDIHLDDSVPCVVVRFRRRVGVVSVLRIAWVRWWCQSVGLYGVDALRFLCPLSIRFVIWRWS